VAILFYQLMIAGSLLAVRVIAPRRLLTTCLFWSSLTIINVFWPPLIAVQLLVIWITYALIQPAQKKSASEARSGEPRGKSAAEPRPVTRPASARPPMISTLNAWDDHVARMRAIDTACEPLASVCSTERIRIEVALDNARPRLEIERKKRTDPRFAALYEANLAKRRETMAHISAKLDDGAPKAVLEPVVCGDLTVMPHHPDARVRDGIRAKIASEIAVYAELLRTLTRTFEEPGMRPVFERSLTELKAGDLLLRIAAFGKTGVDWRNPATFRAAPERVSVTSVAPPPIGATRRMTFGALLAPTLCPIERQPSSADLRGPQRALADELEAAATQRGIPRLVHFTHAANLESILKHGLYSVTEAQMFGFDPAVNDSQRLDGHPWSVSLSIASPNHKMFYKYRMLGEGDDWVVLLVDRAVLWKKDCAFYPRNAADHRMRELSSAGQKTIQAFESMYAPLDDLPAREAQRLNVFDPTDPQAEVLVFGRIEPGMIQGVAFDSAALRARFTPLLGAREARLYSKGRGFFGARDFNPR
jgi:hypothetical protein